MLSASSRRRWLSRAGSAVGMDGKVESVADSAVGMLTSGNSKVEAECRTHANGQTRLFSNGVVVWISCAGDRKTRTYTRRKCSTGDNKTSLGKRDSCVHP